MPEQQNTEYKSFWQEEYLELKTQHKIAKKINLI